MKGAPAVHFNLPLLSFYLYITFKTGIAAASEPIPLEKERFGEWDYMRHDGCCRGADLENGNIFTQAHYLDPKCDP